MTRTGIALSVALTVAALMPVDAQVLPPTAALWHQDVPGVGGVVESGDTFGAAGAIGDFNGDGFGDLAVGVPGEDLTFSTGTYSSAGMVNVLYGGGSGLGSAGNQVWHQGVAGVAGAVESGDRYGAALAAADFDGDGRDDLAIGVPDESVDGVADAGAVNVLYGSSSGLTAEGDEILHTGLEDVPDWPIEGDRFGRNLATGDFDNDGYADLAISAPGKTYVGVDEAGVIYVAYGSPGGLTAPEFWSQLSFGFDVRQGERFGEQLAVGDFNGDTYEDLAFSIRGVEGSGEDRVNVLFGTFSGLTVAGSLRLEVDWDAWGRALAGGDFDADGYDDLAVGAPDSTFDLLNSAGQVAVLYGDAPGGAPLDVNGTKVQVLDQSSPGIDETPEAYDRFGFRLAVGDFDGDGNDDLVVGTRETITWGEEGLLHIFTGSDTGLAAAVRDTHTLLDLGGEYLQSGDLFPRSLACGDLDGDGHDDLAAGAPYYSFGQTIAAGGAVALIYGGLFGDGMESGDTSWWSATVP